MVHKRSKLTTIVAGMTECLLWAYEEYGSNPTVALFIMRPSSLGGGRILRRTLSVCPSVPLSDVGCSFFLFYSRTVLRANIQNRKTSVFAYGPASRMYFSARTEGRISYGHLGRTNSCFILFLNFIILLGTQND